MSRAKRLSKVGLLAVLALVAVVALGACAGEEEGKQLKVGLLFSFTGGLSSFGPVHENGAKLAVKNINDAGGVLGKPLVTVRADDGTAPQQGVAEATRLVNVEKVNAIVGPLGSGVTLAVAESVTVPNKILQVTQSATSPALTAVKDNDYLFRTPISDAAQGVVLAQLAKDLGLKSICAMYVNNAYGQGLSETFAKAFEKAGGKVTARVSHEESGASFKSELSKCVEGKPEALAAISYPKGQADIYLKEALEGRLIDKFIFVDGTKDDALFKALGWAKFQGMKGTAPGALETAGGKLFDSLYEKEYGQKYGVPFVREAYDAVVVIALAAEKAKSTDPTKIRDALRDIANGPGEQIGAGPDQIKRALDLIRQGKDIDYQGATGSVEFDENGDVAVGAIEVWKIEGEKFVTEKVFKVDLKKGEVTPIQ